MDPPVHAARGPGPQQRGPSEGWGTLGHTHSEAGDRVTCASRVHSDRDCERFLNSPRSGRVVPSEGLALDKDYKQLWTSPTLCLLLALLRSEAAVIL